MKTELDKWSDALPNRRIIEEFLGWARDREAVLMEWNEIHGEHFQVPIDGLLDTFYEIDRKKLDDERLELLAQARKGAI